MLPINLPARRLQVVCCALASLLLALANAQAFEGSLETVLDDAGPSSLAVVTTIRKVDGLTFSDTEMGQRLSGVLARWRGDELEALRACLETSSTDIPATSGTVPEPMAYLHFNIDQSVISFEIAALDENLAIVRDLASDDVATARIIYRSCLESLYVDPHLFRGPFMANDRTMQVSVDVDMPRPYIESPYYLDENLIRERIHPTAKEVMESFEENTFQHKRWEELYNTHVLPTTRVLENETMKVRLPAGYDGRTPAGLFVWCKGWGGAGTHPVFPEGLDELGFICVSAAFTHNGRHATDRKQLMLDLVATTRAYFHIDSRRVYVSGISGGGKISSVLVQSFPEIFYGSVPIVGFSTYNQIRGIIPEIEKPKGEQLALARLRPQVNLTGEYDFNYQEIIDRVERLHEDGFPHVSYINMGQVGHVMPPTPAHFTEGLAKVDEIYQKTWAAEVAAANEAMGAYLASYDAGDDLSPEARQQLTNVMRLGPWTEAAWQAAEMLR